ncbi:hypothetical protein HK098_007071, partial [Nowakowskiella sp. JEL0407]
ETHDDFEPTSESSKGDSLVEKRDFTFKVPTSEYYHNQPAPDFQICDEVIPVADEMEIDLQHIISLKDMPDLIEDEKPYPRHSELTRQQMLKQQEERQRQQNTQGTNQAQQKNGRVNNKKNKKGKKKELPLPVNTNAQTNNHSNQKGTAQNNHQQQQQQQALQDRYKIGDGGGGVVDGFTKPMRSYRSRRIRFAHSLKNDEWMCFFCEYEQMFEGGLWRKAPGPSNLQKNKEKEVKNVATPQGTNGMDQRKVRQQQGTSTILNNHAIVTNNAGNNAGNNITTGVGNQKQVGKK